MSKNVMLALKNLTRQKRRNAVLAIAIAFGFLVVTCLDILVTGMITNREKSITQIAGGTVMIAGYEKKALENEDEKIEPVNIIRDRDYVKNLVEKCKVDYEYCSRYTLSMGSIIFNGKKSLCSVYGRDFSEKEFVNSFQIMHGSLENLNEKNAIIISNKQAQSLNLEVGDELIYSTSTIYGQKNVCDLKVAVIYKENSFVSSNQVYADIEFVNSVVEIPEGGYTTFTIFLKNKNKQAFVANQIENAIRADGIPVSSRIEAYKNYPKNPGKGIHKQFIDKEQVWEGTKYGVETLQDAIPSIAVALSVVHTVCTTILMVILLIVMVGVSNTYKMVLYERIREIGTMKALGMTGKDVKRVFTLEAVFLCLIGALAGFVLGILVMLVLHYVPISNESIAIFLNKGHFSFVLPVSSFIEKYVILICLTVFAVRKSAKKASLLSPAEALRTLK